MVPPNPDITSSDGLVRAGLDLGRLSWAKPLQIAYEGDFASVASFFAGNPREDDAWAQMIARVSQGERDRRAVGALVEDQLARRAAPAEARAAAAQLSDPSAVAVLTGQQAGLFGGPLYTLLKAITTIQLARRVATEHGRTVVAIFWVASEDHDWNEVRSTAIVDRNGDLRTMAVPDIAGAGDQPVGALTFDERIASTVADLFEALPQTVWTEELRRSLSRHYVPGSNLGSAMAGWLDQLLGRYGLVVFDGADPAAKPFVRDLFVGELEAPERTAGSVRARGEALRARGYPPQVMPAEHATALFYLNAAGRHPIRYVDAQFRIGRETRRTEDLVSEAAAHPERFSPNVMLRPIVQDKLFPTICYVAGPGELAYQAQFGDVYASFGVERPLFASRASITVLDRPTVRFLERYALPFEDLSGPDESALNRLVGRVLAPDVGPAVDDTARAIDEKLAALKTAAAAVDPTLAGAADTTVGRMHQVLDTLHRKILRAAKRRDDTLRRQFAHARTVSFPKGQPQDRVLGVAAVLNQHGPAFIDQLLAELPADGSRHFLVVP